MCCKYSLIHLKRNPFWFTHFFDIILRVFVTTPVRLWINTVYIHNFMIHVFSWKVMFNCCSLLYSNCTVFDSVIWLVEADLVNLVIWSSWNVFHQEYFYLLHNKNNFQTRFLNGIEHEPTDNIFYSKANHVTYQKLQSYSNDMWTVLILCCRQFL